MRDEKISQMGNDDRYADGKKSHGGTEGRRNTRTEGRDEEFIESNE